MLRPKVCREIGCDTKIILARRAFTGAWMAFEYADKPPFSDEATGCYVVVNDLDAYRPNELIEDLQLRWEISEAKAREHAEGHPWRRAHIHEVDPDSGELTRRPTTKENTQP